MCGVRYPDGMRTLLAALALVALAQSAELHQAARVCDVERMRRILAQSPSLNEPDEDGNPPLHVAIGARKTACVALLRQAGADRGAKDRKGRSAWDMAKLIPDTKERANVLYTLMWGNQMSPAPQGPAPWSLEYSVARGQTSVTKMLLEMGADPNAPGRTGNSPLADAALKGKPEAVEALLEAGARVDAVSPSGTQAIHDAALSDSPEVIRLLAVRGADVNARTRQDAQTPLHVAASMGRLKSIEALLALGADRTLRDARGRTPQQTAEQAGLDEAAAFLRRSAGNK